MHSTHLRLEVRPALHLKEIAKMDESTARTLISKAKLGTAEMKMKTRIRKCFNLLPKDKAMKLDDKISALVFDIGLPIRVSRINKTKKNP